MTDQTSTTLNLKEIATRLEVRGYSVGAIAGALDLKPSTVNLLLGREPLGINGDLVDDPHRLELEANVTRLYHELQWPAHDICRHLSISTATLYTIVRDLQLPMRRGKTHLSEQTVEIMLEAYMEEEISVKEICRILQVSPNTLYSYVDEADIPRRRQSG